MSTKAKAKPRRKPEPDPADNPSLRHVPPYVETLARSVTQAFYAASQTARTLLDEPSDDANRDRWGRLANVVADNLRREIGRIALALDLANDESTIEELMEFVERPSGFVVAGTKYLAVPRDHLFGAEYGEKDPDGEDAMKVAIMPADLVVALRAPADVE